MTDSLKWVVSGAAAVIFVGAVIGAHSLSGSSVRSANPSHVVATASGDKGYPAPEVSIVAQAERPTQDTEMLARSSSFYGDGGSYSRKHSGRKHSHHKKDKTTTDTPNGIDPEMGLISADDRKLREAEAKVQKENLPAESRDWTATGPNGR